MNELLDAYWWNRAAYYRIREPIRPGEHQFLWAYQLQHLILTAAYEVCANRIEDCEGVLPMQAKYFLSPYLGPGTGMNMMRKNFPLHSLVLQVLAHYSDNKGAIWWFEGHPNYEFIRRVQKGLEALRWFLEAFLPAFVE